MHTKQINILPPRSVLNTLATPNTPVTLSIFAPMQDFNTFIHQLRARLNGFPLPGQPAQLSMAPVTRKEEYARMKHPGSPRQSAVLVLFYALQSEPAVVFIKRPVDNTVHSGQVAFPGGRMEDSDRDYTDTALREAMEEVNVQPKDVTVIGALSKLHIPPSNFDVYPIIGYTPKRPDFIGNHEVDKILEVPLAELMNPKTKTTRTISHRLGKLVEVPCYLVQGEVIWGATAMMLGELLSILNRKQPPHS